MCIENDDWLVTGRPCILRPNIRRMCDHPPSDHGLHVHQKICEARYDRVRLPKLLEIDAAARMMSSCCTRLLRAAAFLPRPFCLFALRSISFWSGGWAAPGSSTLTYERVRMKIYFDVLANILECNLGRTPHCQVLGPSFR